MFSNLMAVLIVIIQLLPDKLDEDNARMTTEQLKELSEALSILSAKSSVLQERDELRSLMEENLQAEEVGINRYLVLAPTADIFPYFYRIRNHRRAR